MPPKQNSALHQQAFGTDEPVVTGAVVCSCLCKKSVLVAAASHVAQRECASIHVSWQPSSSASSHIDSAGQ